MAIPRTRPGNYPAVLSYGFRPFFLLGALHAGASIIFWLPLFHGTVETASVFAPVDWHIHEMLFGYLAAIVTGFLLTAIPNWTGRLPVQGLPLLGLVVLWFAGRVAVAFSAQIGWMGAAVIDCAFLLAVALAAAIEIVAGRNWRNLKVVVPVSVLFLANAAFHLEAHFQGISDVSRRLGIGAAIMLITIIGGRIIPSFTRNWLVRENPGRLPVPFNRLDAAIIIVSALALAAWTFAPELPATGWVMIAAAGLNLLRLSRWAGERTLRDPLVVVLHVAYLFIPAGFLLAGLQALLPDAFLPAAGLHAFGVGAVGSMTLAVMTRATLGHTGRELRASNGNCAIYALVAFAALVRIAAAFMPDMTVLIDMSAGLWAAAFLGYAAIFGTMLVKPKLRALPVVSKAE
ncbi:short-chain dehydrogenase [Mesorhizobium sp. Root157]|uniref:NnrS family protein n=1 Tax=Mesorhizobium sp. Root157 TaxID=1736477 RepID=UPI0006F6BFBD|nr:NnrS family protein [Mesorhizobium sp. Root157]KQZ82996.1 short-chain dehydrogenase [Mesorhizobium sp. Root157]